MKPLTTFLWNLLICSFFLIFVCPIIRKIDCPVFECQVNLFGRLLFNSNLRRIFTHPQQKHKTFAMQTVKNNCCIALCSIFVSSFIPGVEFTQLIALCAYVPNEAVLDNACKLSWFKIVRNLPTEENADRAQGLDSSLWEQGCIPRIHVERMRRGGLLRACISVSLKDVMSLQAPFGVCGTLSPTPRVLGYVCTAFPFARVPIESRCEKGRWKKNSNVSGGLFSAGPAMRQDTMQTFLWAFAHKSSELVFFLLVLSQLSLCSCSFLLFFVLLLVSVGNKPFVLSCHPIVFFVLTG